MKPKKFWVWGDAEVAGGILVTTRVGQPAGE